MMLQKNLKEEIESQLSKKISKVVLIDEVSSLSGGCINNALKIETTAGIFFLKTNSAKVYPGMFHAEAEGLKLLSCVDNLEIPGVILHEEAAGLSFILLEWIEPGRRQNNFFEEFGKRIAELHKHTHTFFGLSHDNYIGSLRQSNKQTVNGINFFIEQRLIKQLDIAGKAISHSTTMQFDALFKKLPSLIPAEAPALLHGDLWNGNFMMAHNGNPCIFDPAVYYGFREADLAMTKLFGGFDESFYQAYHSQFPLQAGWEHRMDIYNLYPLLVHVNLFGGGYTAQMSSILKRYA